MRKIFRISFSIFLVSSVLLVAFYVLSVEKASALTCVLNNMTWRQDNARVGDTVEYKIDGQNCQGTSVKVQIWWDQIGPIDTPEAEVNKTFPSDSNTIIGQWVVPATAGVSLLNAQFYVQAHTGSAGTGADVDSRYNGSIKWLTIVSYLNPNPEVQITDFHITPNQIPANTVTKLTVTFKAHVNTPAYLLTRCSSGIRVYLLNDSGTTLYTGDIKIVNPADNNPSYDFDYNYNAGGDGTVNLKGAMECFGNSILVTLPTSSAVTLTIGSGGETTPNCGLIQCSAGGQCNNGFTGPCRPEHPEDCGTAPAICAGGVSQPFHFSVPNWLLGSNENATIVDVIKVIINWIRNIAIPIAVGMIIWGGIMYLTAGPFPKNVDKAKNIIKYAVLGLAIIFIGSGFITLIQSILTLGVDNNGIDNSQTGTGTGQDNQPPLPAVKYGCNDLGFCIQNSAGSFTSPFCNGQCNPGGPDRTIGSLCQNQAGCLSGLVCNQGFCQKQGGNVSGEPCNIDTNCISGLFCDKLGTHLRVMDGRSLGTCIELESTGVQLGDACQRNNQCPAGLQCNQICQRSGGNLTGEACLSPNNCQSNSCRTVVGDTLGKCVSQ
ncbi:MAG: pilin [Planctomycetota bacterium]